jgi:hypothetical protein
MVDWKLVLFWVGAMSIGVATWWALLAWFGAASAVVAIVLLGLAATAGALLDRLPQPCRASNGSRSERPPEN